MTLEEEIQKATERIETRTTEFDLKISALETKISTYTNWAWGFVFGGFAIGIFGLVYYCNKTPTDYGLNVLGDFYGGSVASIWSLAGLFFIYVAFLGQKQQLMHQQMEIMYSQIEVKYTRLELEGQKKEMIEQNNTLRQQKFENTFFQLLRNHQDIVNGIDIRTHSSANGWVVSSQGRDCFTSFYKNFSGTLNPNMSLEITLEKYMTFYNLKQSDLGHYFRNLYHILKFINNSKEIEETEKFKYTSLLRALLSSHELALLFYNGLCENGEEFFKPLIEKFSFLKNIDTSLIINPAHKNEYKEIAFADSKRRQEILNENKKNVS